MKYEAYAINAGGNDIEPLLYVKLQNLGYAAILAPLVETTEPLPHMVKVNSLSGHYESDTNKVYLDLRAESLRAVNQHRVAEKIGTLTRSEATKVKALLSLKY